MYPSLVIRNLHRAIVATWGRLGVLQMELIFNGDGCHMMLFSCHRLDWLIVGMNLLPVRLSQTVDFSAATSASGEPYPSACRGLSMLYPAYRQPSEDIVVWSK